MTLKAVSLGFSHLKLQENIEVFHAPERPNTKAEIPPPFASAEYYDAKLWRFAKEHASPNALIWNVAA
jgi:hypothetical protein